MQLQIATASETDNYSNYYSVINSFVANRTPMGPEWADYITRSILYYCGKWQVDPLLITAMFANESSFDMRSVSKEAGAIGIAQLMPETAASIGVKIDDPAQNMEGGIIYLRQQLDTFQYAGDLATTYAVAAYNAGPGKVKQYHGVPPYSETINYINAICQDYNQLYQELQYKLN